MTCFLIVPPDLLFLHLIPLSLPVNLSLRVPVVRRHKAAPVHTFASTRVFSVSRV